MEEEVGVGVLSLCFWDRMSLRRVRWMDCNEVAVVVDVGVSLVRVVMDVVSFSEMVVAGVFDVFCAGEENPTAGGGGGGGGGGSGIPSEVPPVEDVEFDAC
jgi:hypothetical protein